MKNIFDFLSKIGELKRKKRRGWLLHKIKNPETTAEHIFHLAIFVWLLGKNKNLNLEKAIKMALIHDICEVYAPDLTSYDAKALKEKGKATIKEILNLKPIAGRPTIKQRKKLEEIKKKLEDRAMKKLLAKLPINLKKEINHLWLEYENGLTKEARFVKQADKMINLFQGFLYWKKYGKIPLPLWIRRAKEVLDDPLLLKFLKEIEKNL
jgi:putative hydrolase of HD superfamily